MNVNGIEVKKVLKFRATPGFGKWKRYFPNDAVNHPAKANLNLIEYLILNYTNEGDAICDPMSGSGSTGILAALNNRNAICVELEDKFYEMQVGVDCDGYSCHVLGCCERRELEEKVSSLQDELENVDEEVILEAEGKLEKLPKKPHHFIGCKELFDKTTLLTPKGSVIFLKGDARRLSDILKDHADEVSHVLFSPPYGDIRKGGGICKTGAPHDTKKALINENWMYSENDENIGNLPTGDIDSVIFSPPYSSAGAKADENPENYMRRMGERHELMKEQGIKRPEMDPGRYSGNPDNIGNLPFGEIPVIITSPPFAHSLYHMRNKPPEFWEKLAKTTSRKAWLDPDSKTRRTQTEKDFGYGDDERNIGNLRFGVSCIVTSPPYAQSVSPYARGSTSLKEEKEGCTHIGCLNMLDGYSESTRNIGNLPLNLDVCMFSPPYSVGHDSGNHASEEHGWRLEEQRKHTRAYGGGNIAKGLTANNMSNFK